MAAKATSAASVLELKMPLGAETDASIAWVCDGIAGSDVKQFTNVP